MAPSNGIRGRQSSVGAASTSSAPGTNGNGAAAPSPAWRQFSFFGQTIFKDHHNPAAGAPEILRAPPLISAIASSPALDLVLLADLDGAIHVLSPDYEVLRTWPAYSDAQGREGRCTHMEIAEGRWTGIVVTLGEEPGSPFPVLKIWDLGRTPSAASTSPPLLLRATKVQPSSKPHPVSALALSPSLSHIVLGLADGTVVAYRHIDQLLASSPAVPPNPPLGLGKVKVIHDAKEPITGLGFRGSTLFITTTTRVLACPLAPKTGTPAVLDEIGAALGCSAISQSKEGARMVVAKEEAIYVYGEDGREGCYAYEGPKSSIKTLSSALSARPLSTPSRSTYLAIVSPSLTATVASNSATIRNYARALPSSSGGDVAKVTLFDLDNKFVAHTGTFEDGVREVWEAWGAVWVLTELGKLYRLSEQPLASSLSTLFSRNLYTLAVSLARSRDLPPSEVAEIYRRYGDHLYAKSDYEGAMGCYIKTVGTVQASYVIRKFLDAQRLSYLTSYLQELHAQGLANSDHTTLLLNCYTKLADDTALSSFLHSSASSTPAQVPSRSSAAGADPASTSSEPPFDLETAIRVCRQAGYFDHAVWLAERYGAHQDYLRIQIEDRSDAKAALAYLRRLGPEGAEENLRRYGQTLLTAQPGETTKLLVDLCCGTLDISKPDDGGDTDAPAEEELKRKQSGGGDKGYLSYLSYAIPGSAGPEASANLVDAASSPSTHSPSPAVPRPVREASFASTTPLNRKSGLYPQGSTPERTIPGTSSPPEIHRPSPRQFFANYVDHPKEFVVFLETVGKRRYGKTVDGRAANKAGNELPLSQPQSLRAVESDDADVVDEQALWNTLLELYLARITKEEEGDAQTRLANESKALQLLRERDRLPYDETRALLVCTTAGFTDGLVLLYEHLGMYDDIIRFWIDASTTSGAAADSARVIRALHRYGSARPYLYRLVLRYLTTSSELLSRHQKDIVEILDEIESEAIMPPIAVVEILSTNGTASIGLVREYLKRHLSNEKQEIDSDRSLINSYRLESAKKRKEIQELSDPKTPRIFQVTRCSACGGQLELPAVHFMCRHSYHQRCLGENESQCPNCARSQGVIREIRKNNELFAGRHDLFLEEVRESDDGYATIAAAFGKGLMSLAHSVDETSSA